MSDKSFKILRKQIRQIVQEILPEVLTAELKSALYKNIAEENSLRMDAIAKNAQETLKGIDDRQKDFQSLMLRSLTPPAPVVEAHETAGGIAPQS